MKNANKIKVVAIFMVGCMALTLVSKSLISWARELSLDDSVDEINKVIKAERSINQKVPSRYITEGQLTIDMLDQQLENTDIVKLKNSKAVMRYLQLEDKEVLTGEGNIKSEVDNSNSKYFPPIGNQGSLSTCTAWSTVYYQMSYALNKELDRDGKKTENIMSPYWVYSMINNGESIGTYYSDALKILSEIGAVSLKTVPLETSTSDIITNIKAKKENWIEARGNKIKEYYNVNIGDGEAETLITSPDDSNLDAIKRALAGGEILTATTYASCWKTEKIVSSKDAPGNAKYLNEVIVSRCDYNSEIAHRVTIVGYNDNIWVDVNKDGKAQKGEFGAFKIANSYGDMKDNKGFIWMAYDAVNYVSSVDTNPNFPLKSSNRKDGLFCIIGFNVDVDTADDNAFLEMEFSTDNAKSINLNIKAENKKTSEIYEYAPVPFSNSNLMQNIGSYNINGEAINGKVGVFDINLSNVVPGIRPEKIDEYNWEILVNDSTEDKSVVKVNSSKFYNATTKEYMDTSLKQPIELESTDIVITRGKMISDVNTKETNAAMYSFKTTEKKKYTFTSAIEYTDKRYYDIYVLDKEYKGKANEISNAYSRTKTTKDGSVSIKIPEGKYVYCLAKSKSAWDGFMYRNKAKLTIQVD